MGTNNKADELRKSFDLFDTDKDGRITSSELLSAFKLWGKDVTVDEVQSIIRQVDTDKNGTVEFEEFVKLMEDYEEHYLRHTDEDVQLFEAFKMFDHNGDNVIDAQEIKLTMQFLGEDISDRDVAAMIKEADMDNDGMINFEEFKRMMAALQQKK